MRQLYRQANKYENSNNFKTCSRQKFRRLASIFSNEKFCCLKKYYFLYSCHCQSYRSNIKIFISLIIIGLNQSSWIRLLPISLDLVKLMKNNKFDFFQSPHPRNIDMSRIQDYRHHLDDFDNHEEHLFNTPAIHKTMQSPLNIEPFFSCSHRKERRHISPEFPQAESYEQQDNQSIEEEQSNRIEEKIDYSEEEEEHDDLLLTITPRKRQKVEQKPLQEDPTKKKRIVIPQTPISDFKSVSIAGKGLKKLAFEAFRFVSTRKKTTYKEVANSLLEQLKEDEDNAQQSGRNQSKGQMNIKRRVYDALNVLIAVGLLKRSGNKIIGKKMEQQNYIYTDRLFDRGQSYDRMEMHSKKQQLLLEQLKYLQQTYNKKLVSLSSKTKLSSQLNIKYTNMTMLIQRNKRIDLENPEQKQQNNKLTFPFILLLKEEQEHRSRSIKTDKASLSIQQQDENVVNCRFRRDQPINIIGDLDSIKYMQSPRNQERLQNTVPKKKRAQKMHL